MLPRAPDSCGHDEVVIALGPRYRVFAHLRRVEGLQPCVFLLHPTDGSARKSASVLRRLSTLAWLAVGAGSSAALPHRGPIQR